MAPRIKSPLDGTIAITALQSAFLEHLGLIAVVPSETDIKEGNYLLEGGRVPKHYLYLLSPLWNTETVKYKELIETYGGRRPARLMAILYFSDVYSEGFGITIFGTDIQQKMFKKVRRFQAMLDGNGCPALNPVTRKAPRFAPLSE